MSAVAIRAEGLGKKYRLGAKQQPYYSLRDTIASAAATPLHLIYRLANRGSKELATNRRAEFWALRDINIDVEHGEVLGIIGRNGAGKSTLLKLLSEITEPTEGRIIMNGRVASLLEVGTGFHPELTGRENVFLNGAILGMSRAEIVRRFDEIVAFAEVERFVDTQVKHYSSGMYLRPAFAVAAHLEPEVLIVDEVLAVGDQSFQKKCLGKMREVTRGGRTVLLVSHQLASVRELCKTVLVLDRGRTAFHGSAAESLAIYTRINGATSSECILDPDTARTGSGRVRLTGFHLEDGAGNIVPSARVGEAVDLVLEYTAEQDARHVDVGISLHDEGDRPLTVFYSTAENKTYSHLPTVGEFRCRIKKLCVTPQRYRIGARVLEGGVEADYPLNGIGFMHVEGGNFYGTGYSEFEGNMVFYLDASWDLTSSTTHSV